MILNDTRACNCTWSNIHFCVSSTSTYTLFSQKSIVFCIDNCRKNIRGLSKFKYRLILLNVNPFFSRLWCQLSANAQFRPDYRWAHDDAIPFFCVNRFSMFWVPNYDKSMFCVFRVTNNVRSDEDRVNIRSTEQLLCYYDVARVGLMYATTVEH